MLDKYNYNLATSLQTYLSKSGTKLFYSRSKSLVQNFFFAQLKRELEKQKWSSAVQ